MKNDFWQQLKKPILALAPMANVTDAAFRRLITKYGKPDVLWTEFVSAEGLLSAGREKLFGLMWATDKLRAHLGGIIQDGHVASHILSKNDKGKAA